MLNSTRLKGWEITLKVFASRVKGRLRKEKPLETCGFSRSEIRS